MRDRLLTCNGDDNDASPLTSQEGFTVKGDSEREAALYKLEDTATVTIFGHRD